MSSPTKTCRTCGVQQALDAFSRKRSGKYGREGACRPCRVARTARWRRENPEKYAAQVALSPRLESGRAAKRRYYGRNRALVMEKAVQYDRDHPGRLRWRHHRHRLRGDAATVAFALLVADDPCSYCALSGGEVDHIVPSAGGGTSDWPNLTGACRSCNASKGAHSLLYFLAERAS